MLKKFFYGMMAATMLVATSCTDEPMVGGDEATVSFSISTPEIATRAFSDGTTATDLQYAVYDADGEYLFEKQGITLQSGRATVSLQLKNNKSYKVVFWAAAPNAPYAVDFDDETMTVNYVDAVSNDESRDAFYVCEPITVNGNQSIDVKLKRPFAQINIGTNDYVAAQNAGYVPSESYIKVPAYSTMNLLNGKVDSLQTVEFKYAAIPTTEEFPYEKNTYKYLAMTYVLVGAEQELVDVVFGHRNTVEGDSRTVGSVPVRRNYRTNLYGSLLTSNQNVNVEIKPGYDGTENEEVPGYANVSNAAELAEALENEEVGVIVLDGDINLNDLLTRSNDPSLTIATGRTLTFDLNGKKLYAISTQTGKNYNMFDVRGELTVKNGTVEYKHEGANMGWNNSTNLFNVTAGGVLNLEGVTAKNLGGSDMAFVAHLNNWGEVTLNVQNSTLESTYIPVRVFNSGYDMNNVTIKNTTLKGKYCFWVHNYTAADFGSQEKADAQKELLNFDIFNGTNTFECSNEDNVPVIYGFTDTVDVDASGYYCENGTHYVCSASALVVLSNKTIKGGEKVVLTADIDLTGVEFNGLNAFNPENNNTFDGQGFTVSNWTYTGKKDDMGFIKNWVGPIKNVNFENCNLKTGGRSAIVAAKPYGDIENVHVSNSALDASYWACGLIVGMHNSGNVVNCSVENSSIKSTGGTGAMVGVVNETSGTRKFENCNVVGCTIENGGNDPYSGAALAGLINVDNLTLKFINCKQENNKFSGTACYDAFYGYNAGDNTNIVNE